MTSNRPSSRRALGRPGPRGGWALVAKLAVAETSSYGVLAYAFGVFVLPMQHDLGWSRTVLTGAYSLAIVLSGVAAIPVGRWLDRHGARALMTAGSVAAAALRTATGNYRLVMVGVALCASFAGLAMTRAHRLQGRQAVRSTTLQRSRRPATGDGHHAWLLSWGRLPP